MGDWLFEQDRCSERLMGHFGANTLKGFGLDGKKQAIRAAGAVIEYLGETQKAALSLLSGLSTYTLDDFMTLDAATRRNLELTETIRTGDVSGSLLGTIDATITPMGRRLLRQWMGKPLLDLDRIHMRQDQVEALFGDGIWRAEIRDALSNLGDLERLTNRTVAGVANPKDLVGLRGLLHQLPNLLSILSKGRDTQLQAISDLLDPCVDVYQLIEEAVEEDPPATLAQVGVIKPGYSEQLDSVLESSAVHGSGSQILR